MTAAVAERAMERQPKGTPGRVGSWWTAWRLALRMARREVRRDRGRSWFVWLMISVPVAAICGTQVVLASQDVSPAEFLELRLGGATSRLTWVGHAFVPGTDPYRHAVDTENSTPASPAAPIPGWGDDLGTREAALAAWTGSEALTVTVGSATVDEGGYGVVVLGIDTSRPAAADIVRLTAGRLPSGPGEVVATPAWLSLGLPSRGPVTLLDENDRARTVDVVGTAQTRFDQVVYLVGAPDPAVPDPSFLLAGFNPDWQTAQELAQHGFATTSRAIADAPPAGTAEMGQNPNLFYGGLVGTGALLEVALLVGPAFAIGAARQRRSLALAACNGATAGQLRRLTLGQALLLGSTAATVGIVAGTLAGAAAWPIVSADPTQLNGPLEIPATFLLLIWALGTATAVAAALVSSRGLGRLDLVAALRGTVRPAGPNRHAPRWGLLLLALGLAGTWASTRLDPLGSGPSFWAWFAAIIAATVGALLSVPALLAGLATLGGRLPVVPRLACRDLGRHRGRATATIAASTGGALLLGVVWTMVASIDADIERMYQPSTPPGQGELAAINRSIDGLQAVVAAVEPSLVTHPLAEVVGHTAADSGERVVALRPGCTGLDPWDLPDCRSLGSDDRTILAAATADLTALFDLTPAQAQALDSGHLLVDTAPGDGVNHNGTNELIDGHLRLAWSDPADPSHWHSTDLPAFAISPDVIERGSSSGRVGALITPQAAARHQLAVGAWSLRVIDPTGPITPDLEQRLNDRLADPDWPLDVERGYEPMPQPGVWAMTTGLGLVAVIGAAMATILATAEQRPFLATLQAVGASPRLSRRLATLQAALLAALGSLVGFGIGLPAGIPLALAGTNKGTAGPTLVLPWAVCLAYLAAVPALAAIIAAISTPARQGIERPPR